MDRSYGSFQEFYPHYLAEHRNVVSRRLHFVGTALLLALVGMTVLSGRFILLLAAPVVGYGFAWAGHFLFEKNRPATFRHPLYSLAGDLAMFRDMLTGRIPF
jgi:hypothetical protein